MLVLVTRPRAQAEATAQRLQELGHEALIAPLMEIRFRENVALTLDEVQGFLITSANGAQALARTTSVRDISVYAVGAHTAQAAELWGFTAVQSADGDATVLAEAVTKWADPQKGELVHVSGDKIASDIEGQLGVKGFHVRREILYDAVGIDELSADVKAALANRALDAVLLYSPESARIFHAGVVRAHLEKACSRVLALCLSNAVARALPPSQFREIRIAVQPNQDALLAQLNS